MMKKVGLLIAILFLMNNAYAEQEPDLVCSDANGQQVVAGIYIRECGDLQFFDLNSPNGQFQLKSEKDIYDFSYKSGGLSGSRMVISSGKNFGQFIKLVLKMPPEGKRQTTNDSYILKGKLDISHKTVLLNCKINKETFDYIAEFN